MAGHLRPGQRALPAGGHDDELRALLDEALGLATARAGGIAWESLFRFDGGAPPWVSGLSQGTGAPGALARGRRAWASRATSRPRAPRWGSSASPPPEGVRVDTPVGAHYLQYSFAPRLHIINGFVQALNGLYDFAACANDADGARALRRRRGAGARRAADLRHRRVVAVPARPRERPRLPRAPARLPARAVQARPRPGALLHRGRPLHRLPAPAARARPEVDLRAWPRGPRSSSSPRTRSRRVTLTVLRKGTPVLTRSARFGYGPPRLRPPSAPARAGSTVAPARRGPGGQRRRPRRDGSRSGRAE